MDLEGGLTPIDTVYEWSGLVMAERFSTSLLWSWALVGTIVAAALLRVPPLAYRRGGHFSLVAYPVSLLFMLFLLSPVSVSLRPKNAIFSKLWSDPSTLSVQWGRRRARQSFSDQEPSVQVPRIVGLSHKLMESAIRRMITDVRENSAYTLFRWQAVVAAREQAAILDAGLRDRFHQFLKQCYWPARALGGATEEKVDPTKVTAEELPVFGHSTRYSEDMELEWRGMTVPCHEENQYLLETLYRHLEDNQVHRFSLQAALDELGKNGASQADVTIQYLARLLYNETFTKIRENEIARLQEA